MDNRLFFKFPMLLTSNKQAWHLHVTSTSEYVYVLCLWICDAMLITYLKVEEMDILFHHDDWQLHHSSILLVSATCLKICQCSLYGDMFLLTQWSEVNAWAPWISFWLSISMGWVYSIKDIHLQFMSLFHFLRYWTNKVLCDTTIFLLILLKAQCKVCFITNCWFITFKKHKTLENSCLYKYLKPVKLQ